MSSTGNIENKPAELFTEQWSNLIDTLSQPPTHLEELNQFLNNESISPLTRYLFVVASYDYAITTMEKLSVEAQEYVVQEIRHFATPLNEYTGRLWMQKALLEFLGRESEFIDPRVSLAS